MLAIKSLQTQSNAIPTLLFDEIDTGVSGEVAHAMGEIMKGLSQDIQIISITHLAQIAGKGKCHFKVYKEEFNGATQTRMVELHTEQRVVELAEMISGKNPSETALATARELLVC
jgi:DNA repair protein RecN (Recombination protein N)